MLSQLWMISMPGPTELIVILLILLLVFGAKRLPEIARSFGEAIKGFKKSLTQGSSGTDKKD